MDEARGKEEEKRKERGCEIKGGERAGDGGAGGGGGRRRRRREG